MSIVRLSLTFAALASFGNAACVAGQPPEAQTLTEHARQLHRNRDGDWWQFRGPGARGVADNASFPDRWSATENVAWKTDVPGRGGSSPVVRGNSVFLTTVVNRGVSEPPKKGLYLGGDRLLYVLLDRGMLFAYDAKTGKPFYERERIPQVAGFTASPWAVNGKIFCLDEDGTTHVFRAGERFDLLHANRLADDDTGMATPAIVGDRLLLRTSARLYCIAKP